MSRNTNALFWIICGAIFVTTVYLIVTTDVPSMITNLFSHNNDIVNSADNGAVPTAPAFVESKSTSNSLDITFKKSENASRYHCQYGTEKAEMKKNGIVYVKDETIVCQISNLKADTKYYIQLSASNVNKKTSSPIIDVKTKVAD